MCRCFHNRVDEFVDDPAVATAKNATTRRSVGKGRFVSSTDIVLSTFSLRITRGRKSRLGRLGSPLWTGGGRGVANNATLLEPHVALDLGAEPPFERIFFPIPNESFKPHLSTPSFPKSLSNLHISSKYGIKPPFVTVQQAASLKKFGISGGPGWKACHGREISENKH